MDSIGVIVGPDLISRDGEIVTAPEKRSRQDQSIKGYKKELRGKPDVARSEADAIIKSTYRTLMAQGMKSCYIYCTDPETAAYFRGRIAQHCEQGRPNIELRMVADNAKDTP